MRRRTFLTTAITPLVLRGLDLPSIPRLVARPVPSPSQLEWHREELSLFLHFGVNTFTDREWGDGKEDPGIFNPLGLDARQWARTARAAGFKKLILTAKHHDGFCLWPSKLTSHSVAGSPWRDGKGDVVRELVDACKAERLKVGLYLSPWDRHEASYGDSPRYNDFYIAQLTELLTQYGPVAEVWFDGANGEGPNGKRQVYDWERIHRTVRRLQPKAVMFSDAGPDIRWIGNERGIAGDPNWCTMDPAAVPYAGADGPGIIDALQHGDPNGSVWRPGEADVSIRPGWFYHPAEDSQVRSPDNLMDLYFSSVGRNAGLLLNVPPTRDGLLHPVDVRNLSEFGARIRTWFGEDLSRGASGGGAGGHSHSTEGWVELTFPAEVEFDVLSLGEAIERTGQLVENHSFQVWNGRGWTTLVDGTTIGYKRLYRIPKITSRRVRLVHRSSFGIPRSRIGLYHSGT